MTAARQEDSANGHMHKIQGQFEEGEEWLQKYLGSHSDLLPMRDLEGIDFKLRLIGRELSGMDLLFADKGGLLTVVETKLPKNWEVRRTVLAQLLDYAATLKKWKIKDLCLRIALLSERSTEGLPELRKLSEALHKLLRQGEFTSEDEKAAKTILANYVLEGEVKGSAKRARGAESFLSNLDSMLGEGSCRLVIVTYEVSSDLLDLLNYVNSTTQRGHQLAAVELSRVDLQDGKYFIPHLVGAPQTLSPVYYRENIEGRVYGEWTPEDWIRTLPEDLQSDGSDLVAAIRRKPDELWCEGGGGKDPTLNVRSAHSEYVFLEFYADGKVKIESGLGPGSKSSESQKRKLWSLFDSTPFLKKATEDLRKSKERGTSYPIAYFDFRKSGKEGERWKSLLGFLEEYDQIISAPDKA